MKKIMLIGETSSGKTTLTQVLNDKEIGYKKTQALEYANNILDTPGEYIENRRYYNAIIMSSVDYDIIGFVQDSTSNNIVFPPNFASMFNKKVIGIITKIDCCNSDVKKAKEYLERAGVGNIFYIDSISNRGIENIRKLLQ
ncbi:EutP/PduV family microcompartment system protein [Anaerosalibacter massiliensis]|uniref:EutP/PduV family microcompartment system protein n=1 Tax=Anaerosalibacter massiliensis TaxID=1347392 RepID=A0A9X2MGY5_9FIRM|nr:EutP/PduV family microcompartment system protein [Anaerosalibacter massiliensis]MCR2043820.1 EutP/PduV family microcompartment system protein [Anaerosalibacter massiliensis]